MHSPTQDRQPAPDTSERAARPDFRLAPLRVVLIEDSAFDAELVRVCLMAAYPRAVLDVVTDEDSLLERLVRDDVDVILSDYRLIGFNGADALRLALTAASNAPFIMVSGVIGEENAVEMMKQGATDYVSKNRLARLPVVIERALHEVAERRGRGVAESQLREAGAGAGAGAAAGSPTHAASAMADRAVFVLNTDGTIASSNPAAVRMFGHAIGASGSGARSAAFLFTAIAGDDTPLHSHLRDALAHGQASHARWMVRFDQTRFYGEGSLTSLYDGRGQHSGFSYTVSDPTGTTP